MIEKDKRDEFKMDRKRVLEMIECDGWTLEYASDELKNDRELLEAAKH